MKNEWNWKAVGTAAGIFWGAYMGLSALLEMSNAQLPLFNSETFGMLTAIYPAITPTPTGAVVGLVIGAICGTICGSIFAGLYNWANGLWK